jgi:predicted transcriptional regulator
MTTEWLEIEQLAANANKGVSTVRKYLKDLSKGKKDLYIKKIHLEGKGGIKHLYHKDLITLLFSNDRDDKDVIETIQNELEHQEQIKMPDNAIIELLKKQIEDKDKEIEFKNSLISDMSKANLELIDRLKEINFVAATAQKQLTVPQDKQDIPKWWQFWK